MAIRPISSVSFNNNISFESKPRKENKHSSRTTAPVKAVPLAVLLAMSPVSSNVYANDPVINDMEQVQDLNSVVQNQKIPFPSHFTYLNKYVVNMPNNEKLGLYFIDSNGDKNNYEYFEYIHVDSNDNVKARGLLTHVRFKSDDDGNIKTVYLYGIGLDKNDLDNYAPKLIMADHMVSDDVFGFFARTVDALENNAFERLPKGVSYGGPETYVKYLNKYKNDVGKN